MWAKIKAFFGPSVDLGAAANAAAHQRLQELREAELSVGAEMRRGIVVTRAPGQIRNTAAAPEQAPFRQPTMPSPAAPGSPRPTGEDGALSLVTSATTGSVGAGYVLGGSLTGALVGASLLDSAATDCSSTSTTE